MVARMVVRKTCQSAVVQEAAQEGARKMVTVFQSSNDTLARAFLSVSPFFHPLADQASDFGASSSIGLVLSAPVVGYSFLDLLAVARQVRQIAGQLDLTLVGSSE